MITLEQLQRFTDTIFGIGIDFYGSVNRDRLNEAEHITRHISQRPASLPYISMQLLSGSLLIVDVDTQESASLLQEEVGELDTLTVRTPHGFHYYFRNHDDYVGRSVYGLLSGGTPTTNMATYNGGPPANFKRGVDILTRGAVVVPPTDGYAIIDPDKPINELPENLLSWLNKVNTQHSLGLRLPPPQVGLDSLEWDIPAANTLAQRIRMLTHAPLRTVEPAITWTVTTTTNFDL